MHPSSSSENTTCGKAADTAGGARMAAYTARGGASVFNRLIGWFGQKMRQASLLIRNREPQSLQLWYTSHFPPALGFLSTLMISSFLFPLYWITRSLNKGFIDPTQQRGQL